MDMELVLLDKAKMEFCVPETKCNSACNQWMDIQRHKNRSVWDHMHVNHTSHMSIGCRVLTSL